MRFGFILLGLVSCLLFLSRPAWSQTVTLTGRVVDEHGKPVAGATVAQYQRWKPGRPEAENWARATTDAAGQFSLAVERAPEAKGPPRRACVAAPGYAVASAALSPDRPTTVTLSTRWAAVAGQVLDEAGKPLAGARAQVYTASRPGDPAPVLWPVPPGVLEALTDAGGAFRIGGLPAGSTATMWFSAPGKALEVEGSVTAGTEDMLVVLPPGGCVRGRVLHDGQPVAGAYVHAAPSSAPGVVTSADGSYLLEGLRPGGQVSVWAMELEGLMAAPVGPLTVYGGETATAPDILVLQGARISGTVRWKTDGRPAAGQYLNIMSFGRGTGNGLGMATSTNDAGEYAVTVWPGKVKVTCYPRGPGSSRSAPTERTVELVAGQTTAGVDLELPPAPKPREVTVVVLGPDHKVAAGVEVPTPEQLNAGLPAGVTDERGQITLALPPAPDQPGPPGSKPRPVMLVACDRPRGLVGTAVLRQDQDSATVILGEGAYVVAKVLDLAGEPVPKAPVIVLIGEAVQPVRLAPVMGRVGPGAMGPGDLCMKGESDARGMIRLGPLPTDLPLQVLPDRSLAAMTVDETWQNADLITLLPGDEHRLPDLELNPAGATAAGRVLDPDGKPVPGAIVFALRPGWALAGDWQPLRSRARLDGRFRFDHLPARGMVKLLALDPSRRLCGMGEAGPGGGDAGDLTLRPPGKVRGRMLLPDGRPLANASLSVMMDSSGSSEVPFYYDLPQIITRLFQVGTVKFSTDATGAFEVDGLFGGLPYRVFVQPPAGPPGTWQSVGNPFTAVGGQTVDLGEMKMWEPPGGRK